MSNQYVGLVAASSGQPNFTDLGGNISPSQMNNGTGASSSTFWRGDGTWSAAGAGSANWDALGNAGNNLLLSNANFTTEFDQTSAVNWTWKNTTAATNVLSQSSPIFNFTGTYWTGAASAADSWTLQNVIANGTNGTSKLTLTHSGTTGVASVDISSIAGSFTGTGPGSSLILGANGTGIAGFTSQGVIGFFTRNDTAGNVDLRLHARFTSAYAQIAQLAANQQGGGAIAPSSGSAVILGTLQNTNTTQCVTIAGTGGTGTGPAVQITGNAGGNSKTFQATAGTQYGVMIGGADGAGGISGLNLLFNPASGSAKFVACDICPEINQTSTASGSYTALQVNVKETALLGTANLLLDLQAGATGGTSKFAIDNTGKITVPTTNTATTATAGANGAVPAQVAGYLIVSIGGTTQKIPYFNA